MVKVGFVRDRTLISKMIRFFGKMQTGDARYHHVFFIFDEILTVEALATGLRSQSLKRAYGAKEILIYDLPCIDTEKQQEIKIEAFQMLGKFKSMYGAYKLPIMMFDAILSGIMRKPVFFFSKALPEKWFPICSHFVGYILYKYGELDQFKEWKSFSPDYLDDIMSANPKMFTIDNNLSHGELC